jgi:hypothetical protein
MPPTTGEVKLPGRAWEGRWCWLRRHDSRPWNVYAYFRRAFELAAKPKSAAVRVSADARYTLLVNGRRVHQGPARGYPGAYPYDTLEIADALRPGPNVICAIVHQFGVPTVLGVYRDAAGFLCDGVIEVGDASVALHTPGGWWCRQARGWRQDAARLGERLGFQEHFDAGEDPGGWGEPDHQADEKSGWHAPVSVGPAGCHPWTGIEARAVPLLADHPERFKAVVGQFSGENARGYKIADDVYRLSAGETRKREKSLLENPGAMLDDGGDVTTVTPPAEGKFAMVVLDLGQTRAGHVVLDIADAAADEIIDILYGEAADRSGAPVFAGDEVGATEEAPADRYRCRAGAQRWEPLHLKGFRYAALVFRNLNKPLKIRQLAIRQVHAAVETAGAFECSDAGLNDIWRVGRETLLNCMLDTYVDSPVRQRMWWGDVRAQFRANVYAFGDVSLLERGIRLMAQSQAADGSLHAYPPSDAPAARVPDFMLGWVGALSDHHQHTGRLDLLSDCLPVMHRLFDFFAGYERHEGLVGGFDGFSVFIDSANLPAGDFSASLNLMYLQALRHASALCDLLGLQQPATRYAQKAGGLQATIERGFFDPKVKAWRDLYDPAATSQGDSTSQHANALAVSLNLKPDTHAGIARDVLMRPLSLRRSKVVAASPPFYGWVLEALAATGQRAEVLDVIRAKWGEMLDKGATTFWEAWEPEGQSRCRGASASPVYHISQQVLGVAPAEPGWASVRVAPLTKGLEFARGTVPSPLGAIKVDWEKAEEDQLVVRVDLPSGASGEFIDPFTSASRPLDEGMNEFHT